MRAAGIHRRAGFLLLVPLLFAADSGKHTQSHDLQIVHPGDPKERDIPVALSQHFAPRGEPAGYSTWVDSVICRDEQCRVVKVQLHWDALGRYQRYEVKKGSILTKLDHVPFTPEDHAKLQSILKDKQSPLREVTKDGLVGSKATRGVDGVSGATLLTLKSTVVVGAGYCCYDLWHWANGEVSDIIADMSAKTFSETALKELLNQEDDEAVAFALQAMTGRKLFDADSVEKRVRTGGDALIKPALDYIKAAAPNPAAYFRHVTALFVNGSEEKRVYILNLLAEADEAPPAGTFDNMSAALPDSHSHHELHLFLNLVEDHDAHSDIIARNLTPLLKHEKFFVARRAYWYLDRQELPKDLRTQAEAFQQAHMDRL